MKNDPIPTRWLFQVICTLAALVLCLGALPTLAESAVSPGYPGMAANGDGSDVFELEGNATDDDNDPTAAVSMDDDWANILSSGGSSNGGFNIIALTNCENGSCDSNWPGVLTDPPGTSIFVQGAKDISDITDWTCRDQSAPGKDELTNAYAVAYNVNGDLIAYIGTDRWDNRGTATMGFWLLQADVAPLSCIPAGDGLFRDSGNNLVHHALGDLLIVADFTNGGAIGTIRVFEWVGSGGSDGTLDLLYEALAGTNAAIDCTAGIPGDICGTINQTEVPSPWTYIPKGAAGDSKFIRFGFMEIGVNLTNIFSQNGGQEVPCFSTFLAETRSSAEPSASQKDFVLGSFNVCNIDVSKVCGRNTPNLAQDPINFKYDVGGCFDNSGFGSVTDLNITDAPPFDAGTLMLYEAPEGFTNCTDLGALEDAVTNGATLISDPSTYTLPPGGRIIWLAEFTSTSNGPKDQVTATASGSAGASIEPATSPEVTCPEAAFNPNIDVTKSCKTYLSDEGSYLAVKVDISGTVTNTGDVPLKHVTVNDTMAGSVTLSSTNLAVGASVNYSKTYTPDTIPCHPQGAPQSYKFTDDVTATGEPPGNTGTTVQTDTAHAECPLCPGASTDEPICPPLPE